MYCVSLKKLSLALCGAVAVYGSIFTHAAAGQLMETAGLTSQPIGHYEFCKREKAQCNIKSRSLASLIDLNKNWQLITHVNLSVNERIKPMTDMEIFGVEEYWAYPTTVGDCEDYVLLKQRELAAAGIPLSNLLITVVRKPDGEGHAVLTIRTEQGDFILDNLTDEILNWQDTDYTYLKRQANNHTGRWVTIDTSTNLLVGSVRP